jgi:hypothetical protein
MNLLLVTRIVRRTQKQLRSNMHFRKATRKHRALQRSNWEASVTKEKPE